MGGLLHKKSKQSLSSSENVKDNRAYGCSGNVQLARDGGHGIDRE